MGSINGAVLTFTGCEGRCAAHSVNEEAGKRKGCKERAGELSWADSQSRKRKAEETQPQGVRVCVCARAVSVSACVWAGCVCRFKQMYGKAEPGLELPTVKSW